MTDPTPPTTLPLTARLIIEAMSPRDIGVTLLSDLPEESLLAREDAQEYMRARYEAAAVDAATAGREALTDEGPRIGQDPTHLGDGAYATHEPALGYIWLWAERETGWHRVALNPSGLTALVRYARQHGYKIPEE
jgi:hypothetical protein